MNKIAGWLIDDSLFIYNNMRLNPYYMADRKKKLKRLLAIQTLNIIDNIKQKRQ